MVPWVIKGKGEGEERRSSRLKVPFGLEVKRKGCMSVVPGVVPMATGNTTSSCEYYDITHVHMTTCDMNSKVCVT